MRGIRYSKGTYSTEERLYEIVGEVHPYTYCSFIDDGTNVIKISRYDGSRNIAGIVEPRSDNDYSCFQDGETAKVISRGKTKLYYLTNSGIVARTDFAVANDDDDCGTGWNMVSEVNTIPGFLIGLPGTLFLDRVDGVVFLNWFKKDCWLANVYLKGVNIT